MKNSTYNGGPKSPPTWWNFYTIRKWVEKFHHSVSTFFGGIFHHLQAGGKISANMVEFFHHYQVSGKIPPCRMVEFYHHLQGGGTIPPYHGKHLCVFWHKVCSWLCWNVLCEVKNAMEISDGEWKTTDGRAIVSWNRGKNEQICTVKFQIFLGAMPPDLDTVEGLWRPSSDPEPSAIQRFAPPCLARGRRPLHRPSLCVVDILIYFRPW